MNSKSPNYHGYRFPPEIISHAAWLYHRFCMSFRDVEDLFAQRGKMRKFKSPGQAQRFLSVHGLVQNLFRVGANCCRLAITESYGVARCSLGTRSRAPRDSNGDVTPAAPGLLAQRQLDSTARK